MPTNQVFLYLKFKFKIDFLGKIIEKLFVFTYKYRFSNFLFKIFS